MSAEESNPLAKRRYRRFLASDVDEVAELMAKRFSETQACEVLGINYDSFRMFKQKGKNDARFASSFTRARAVQLKAHVENIEDAAVGAGVHAKADWRASDALIKLKFPELSPQMNAGTITNNTVNILAMHDSLKRVIGIANDATMPVDALLITDADKVTPRKSMPVRHR